MSPLALGGAPLHEGKVVRFAYLDEAGTSSREPVAVVSGVLVHADEQLIPLERHLRSLVEKHIPPADWDGFHFHATNIWSGTKYFKNKVEWPLQRRLDILNDLIEIPTLFGLPITLGFSRKDDLSATLGLKSDKERDQAAHAVAFAVASLGVEAVMREHWSDEVATIIAEDQDHVRQTVRDAHTHFRSKDVNHLGSHAGLLPFERVREGILWATKQESACLQIADTCSFILRGHLAEHPENPPFYERLKDRLVWYPRSDNEGGQSS